jgi:hypothetical protein
MKNSVTPMGRIRTIPVIKDFLSEVDIKTRHHDTKTAKVDNRKKEVFIKLFQGGC